MLWILTSVAGLKAVYGADGAALVTAKASQLAAVGPDTVVQQLAAAAASPPDASALYAELKALVGRGTPPQAILILGEQRAFASFTVDNPVTDRSIDPDNTVLTDNPYGQFDWTQPDQCTVPPVIVGRLATGINETAAGLSALLDAQIALHKKPGGRTGYVEIVSRQWENASTAIMALSAPVSRLIVSPDGRVSIANASVLDCRYLYCNLHGFINATPWSGYDLGLSYPVPALTPDAFLPQYVAGTVAFTEACYGLATFGKATGASNALSLLAAGAAAVVGSTGLAFGTATPQPQTLMDADVLARSFFNAALTPSISVGSCLQNARRDLRNTGSRSDPYITKTLLEFQLLGDPTYVPAP
jgi:hypothetical protein